MMRHLLVFVTLLICLPAATQAVLPRTADFRQKDVFDYRQAKIAEFEKAEQQHEAQMISKDRQTRLELMSPPWGQATGPAAAVKIGPERSGLQNAGTGSPVRKRVFSIVALLFIGGCVWWVKVATESEPER